MHSLFPDRCEHASHALITIHLQVCIPSHYSSKILPITLAVPPQLLEHASLHQYCHRMHTLIKDPPAITRACIPPSILTWHPYPNQRSSTASILLGHASLRQYPRACIPIYNTAPLSRRYCIQCRTVSHLLEYAYSYSKRGSFEVSNNSRHC
jgi:hypothetical protein